jgi:hypothetical protein
MLLKPCKCRIVLACCVLSLAGLATSADDKKEQDKPTLSGAWVKKGAELKIEFSKDAVKIYPHGENAPIVFLCNYTVEKDGLVRATIAGFEGKEEITQKVRQKLPVGLEFTFKWAVKDDNATLDDLKGEKIEAFKSHLEGEYEEKK